MISNGYGKAGCESQRPSQYLADLSVFAGSAPTAVAAAVTMLPRPW